MEQGTGWPAKRKKKKPCCQGGTSDCHDMAWVWTEIWCIPKMNGWWHELSCFFVDAIIKEDWTIYPHVAVETSYTEVVGRKAMAKAKAKSASKACGWRWLSISRWCDRFMCVVVNRYKPPVRDGLFIPLGSHWELPRPWCWDLWKAAVMRGKAMKAGATLIGLSGVNRGGWTLQTSGRYPICIHMYLQTNVHIYFASLISFCDNGLWERTEMAKCCCEGWFDLEEGPCCHGHTCSCFHSGRCVPSCTF